MPRTQNIIVLNIWKSEIINFLFSKYNNFITHEYNCSDRMNWGIYFGYCYWDGDYILYVKQIADSGPGAPSDSTLSS